MIFGLPLQLAGPILAVVTFLTIWWGHIMVRIVHYSYGTRPAPIVFGGGLLLLLISIQVGLDVISAGLGIVGLTLLWDSFELHRQEARVRQGHAPLNPRVHREAAGALASTIADERAGEGQNETGVCLSCGSTETSRYLCRRGPYCKVHDWDKYPTAETADTSS